MLLTRLIKLMNTIPIYLFFCNTICSFMAVIWKCCMTAEIKIQTSNMYHD